MPRKTYIPTLQKFAFYIFFVIIGKMLSNSVTKSIFSSWNCKSRFCDQRSDGCSELFKIGESFCAFFAYELLSSFVWWCHWSLHAMLRGKFFEDLKGIIISKIIRNDLNVGLKKWSMTSFIFSISLKSP